MSSVSRVGHELPFLITITYSSDLLPSHFFLPKFIHALVQCYGATKPSPKRLFKNLLSFKIRPLHTNVFRSIRLTFSTVEVESTASVSHKVLECNVLGFHSPWNAWVCWTYIVARCLQRLSEKDSRFDIRKKKYFYYLNKAFNPMKLSHNHVWSWKDRLRRQRVRHRGPPKLVPRSWLLRNLLCVSMAALKNVVTNVCTFMIEY